MEVVLILKMRPSRCRFTQIGGAAALALCVLLGMPACTANGKRSPGENVTGLGSLRPTPGALNTSDPDHLVAFLFNEAFPASDRTAVYLAEQEETRRCMAAKGFTYTYPAPKFDGAPVNANPLEALGQIDSDGYGYFAKAQAGTLAPTDDGYDESKDPNLMRYAGAKRQAYLDALNGVDPSPVAMPTALAVPIKGLAGMTVSGHFGGCSGQALIKVKGDPSEPSSASNLWYLKARAAEALGLVPVDPQYSKVLDAWKSCMANKGFGYHDPLAAQNAVVQRYIKDGAQPQAHQFERALAGADKSCRDSSGIVPAYRQAVVTAETKYVDTVGEPVILAVYQSYQHAIDRAKKILAGYDIPLPEASNR